MTTRSMALVLVAFGATGLILDRGQPIPYTFPHLLHFPAMPVLETNIVTEEGARLGRYLFYDPILSADSTFSCASCHRQEVAFSDSPNRYSKGATGIPMPRNTMPLFNLAWYPQLFWDGREPSLETQVFVPVRAHDEMNLAWVEATERIVNSPFYPSLFHDAFGDVTIDSVLIARAIAQFECTLISHNSKYDSVLRGEAYFTPEEYQGFVLMNDQTKGDCLHCHTTDADALGTTTGMSNNGLDAATRASAYPDHGRGGVTGDTSDFGYFRIPSLRNAVVTAPYMHDGRFETLEEVIDFYSEGVRSNYNIDSKMGYAHQGGVRLNAEERTSIIAFIRTLTDSVFMSNPNFSNPF